MVVPPLLPLSPPRPDAGPPTTSRRGEHLFAAGRRSLLSRKGRCGHAPRELEHGLLEEDGEHPFIRRRSGTTCSARKTEHPRSRPEDEDTPYFSTRERHPPGARKGRHAEWSEAPITALALHHYVDANPSAAAFPRRSPVTSHAPNSRPFSHTGWSRGILGQLFSPTRTCQLS